MLSKQQHQQRQRHLQNSTKKEVHVNFNVLNPKRTKKTIKTIVTYHTLDHNEAKAKIQEYINKYPGARTGKIIEALRINPEQVVDILDELEASHSVYSREIGQGPR